MPTRARDAEQTQDLGILWELFELVDEGLLNMSMDEDGEAVFWATEKGVTVLGMAT